MAATVFHKMHGLGNDFVIFDSRDAPVTIEKARISALANRHDGIGCDQLIILHPSETADVRMQIYNSDGGEVESCGNASRCVVALLGKDTTIDTAGGIIHGELRANSARIDMGVPRFAWDAIPLDYAMDTAAMPLAWGPLDNPVAVNVGNPHIIFFVEDSGVIALDKLGPQIEHDPLFPERINVNVAHVRDGALHLRVWERGAGLTRACGTGACASAVAAIRRGLVRSPVTVHLPGGALDIAWSGGDTAIFMSGPASYVFRGEIDLEALT